MKKILFILSLSLLIPSALPAQQVLPGREGKIMAMGEFLSQILKREANKQVRAADIQAVAEQQTQKANESLKALLKAYPEEAEFLSAIIFSHQQVTATAAKNADKEAVLKELTMQVALLNNDMLHLRKSNKEVAEQVRQIIRHEYWLACQKEAVSLPKMRDMLAERLKTITATPDKFSNWLPEL